MKSANFQVALRYLLQNEGGYANHAADRGGPTNMGITMHTLAEWRQKPVSVEDIQQLSHDEASDIYFSRYWLVAGCDRIESMPMAIALFDTSVLMGAHTATLYCQMAINKVLDHAGMIPKVNEDGRAGPSTVASINRVDEGTLIACYHDLLCDRTARIVEAHPEQKVFLAGWNSRAKRLLTLLEHTSTSGTSIV